MIELAVFTEEIAEELMARGFQMIGRSQYAYFFEDSAALESALKEILQKFEKI